MCYQGNKRCSECRISILGLSKLLGLGEGLLNRVELDQRIDDCREHPQSAYGGKAKFHHETSVNQTAVLLTRRTTAQEQRLFGLFLFINSSVNQSQANV